MNMGTANYTDVYLLDGKHIRLLGHWKRQTLINRYGGRLETAATRIKTTGMLDYTVAYYRF